VYRFLLTTRWLGALALAVAAAVAMVFLGIWQLHRYQERAATNSRIDAADSTPPVPLTAVLPAPTAAGTAGPAPNRTRAWTKVTVMGRYDPTHEIQARGRTVDGDVGFEIVTPLVLADGTAVLVDRGWIPPSPDPLAAPVVPPAPSGQVTVIGQVHLSESRPTPVVFRDGRLDTRRISVPRLAAAMPYPVYGAYVLLTQQTPPADPAFRPIPIDHENAWQNAGYTVQWWIFAGMALIGYGWLARKEARGEEPPAQRSASAAASAASGSWVAGGGSPALDRVAGAADPRAAAQRAATLDRVAESDRQAAQRAATPDRVAESDRRAAQRAATPDRVAESDRRTAQPAATPDRVAESDRRAAARAAAANADEADPGARPRS
jgi:cytochrome oxidase assembly protein ShyY1